MKCYIGLEKAKALEDALATWPWHDIALVLVLEFAA